MIILRSLLALMRSNSVLFRSLAGIDLMIFQGYQRALARECSAKAKGLSHGALAPILIESLQERIIAGYEGFVDQGPVPMAGPFTESASTAFLFSTE
jgi:hypothetical protein